METINVSLFNAKLGSGSKDSQDWWYYQGQPVSHQSIASNISTGQTVSQSACQTVSQSVSQPVSQSASQTVSQSVSQPVSQSASQTVSQSAVTSPLASLAPALADCHNPGHPKRLPDHCFGAAQLYIASVELVSCNSSNTCVLVDLLDFVGKIFFKQKTTYGMSCVHNNSLKLWMQLKEIQLYTRRPLSRRTADLLNVSTITISSYRIKLK